MKKLLSIVIAAALVGCSVSAEDDENDYEGQAARTVKVVDNNTDAGLIGDAFTVAEKFGAKIITLQEVCRPQFDFFNGRNGWTGHATLYRPGSCADGSDKLLAIFTKGFTVERTDSKKLGSGGRDPEGRIFQMFCAKVNGAIQKKADFRVCTTHIWVGDDALSPEQNTAVRISQIREIKEWVDTWVDNDKRVILTGDFNRVPKSEELDLLHRVTTSGGIGNQRFWEGDQTTDPPLCRCGVNTTDLNEKREARKIDHFFVSHRHVDPHRGVKLSVFPTRYSGHHILLGTAIYQ